MTLENKLDSINQDLAWRKKELNDLWSFISYISNPEQRSYEYRKIHYRSFILLTYAHLEGFIKQGGEYYLEFIKDQNKTFFEINDNFFEEYIKRKVKSNNKITGLIKEINNSAIIYYKKRDIQTNSNINYSMLINILQQFGIEINDFNKKFIERYKDEVNSFTGIRKDLLEYLIDKNLKSIIIDTDEEYTDDLLDEKNINFEETLKNIIDESLLKNRNGISHGEKRELGFVYLEQIKTLTIIILDTFKYLFDIYLIEEKYVKSNL